MKIAIGASDKNLDSQIAPRFGRCAYFLIVEPADMSFEVCENQSACLSSEAGIKAAQFLADMRVTAVITCHIGPNAVLTLSAAGIQVYAQQQGRIKELMKKFQEGNMSSTASSTVGRQFGSRRNMGWDWSCGRSIWHGGAMQS